MSSLATTVEAPAPPVEKFRRDYAPTPYAIDSISLNFDVRESETVVTSTLEISARDGVGAGTPLILDGEELKIVSVEVDGAAFEDYVYAEDQLTLAPPTTKFTLKTVVSVDPKSNTQLSGLYASSGNLCTQCEAEGFRRITFFYDRPDVMSKYFVRVEADEKKYPVLLSNGNQVETGQVGKGRHFATFDDPFLKPSYLFALVAGDLGGIEGDFVTASGRTIRLAIWSEHENVDQLDWSLESLKRSMKWDEDRYGREYDLDVYHIVAVNDFNMGAMENKGLNVFNTACVLAKPSTATDGDYERVLGVVAHEYFHNWSGNRVTCRDWFQLTLKEGLTVFRDQHFTEESTSAAVKRIDDVRIMRSAQFMQDAGPMAHPIRPESYIAMDNFYSVTVYNKGAEVIRMYKTLLGAAGFRKGMDLYFERHDGEAVTCDDFRQAMQDATGKDLAQFERWYTQAGTPTLTVSKRGVTEGGYAVELRQACPSTPGQSTDNKEPFVIPVSAALLDAETGEKVAEQVFELTEKAQTFTFEGPMDASKKYVPSLLRGFSAPVKLVYDPPLSVAELEFVAANDDDAVNRWDAAQQLATRTVLEAYFGKAPLTLPRLIEAMRATLTAQGLDASLRAMALGMPDVSTLMLQIDGEGIDPAKLAATLKATKKHVAKALAPEFVALYDSLKTDEPFAVNPAQVGARRLRNACLSYIAQNDGEAKRCLQHFEAANCMSDSLAAASCLASKTEAEERATVLDTFYQRAKKNNEQLVLNKWFGIQAAADSPDALKRVRALCQHPDFEKTNPNRYRSVVNTFAATNHAAFHASDGSGYAFVAEEVVKMDKVNPQLAARLCGVFGTWRRLDQTRQELIKLRLETIRDAPNLSKDTFEIAKRSLGQD